MLGVLLEGKCLTARASHRGILPFIMLTLFSPCFKFDKIAKSFSLFLANMVHGKDPFSVADDRLEELSKDARPWVDQINEQFDVLFFFSKVLRYSPHQSKRVVTGLKSFWGAQTTGRAAYDRDTCQLARDTASLGALFEAEQRSEKLVLRGLNNVLRN